MTGHRARLPENFPVRLGAQVRSFDGGRTLVGGSPTGVMFLTGRAGRLFEGPSLRVACPASAVLADRLLERGIADPVLAELPAPERADVSVVIPVRDRPESLDRLLSSVHGAARVLVVDDCSTDRSAIADVAERHGVELVRMHDNVGPAQARNEGLRRVATSFVAFVDSDVVLEPDALRRLLRHFSDPSVALVAPRILSLEAGRRGWLSRYEAVRSSLDLGAEAGSVRPGAPVGWVPSACLVARTGALRDGFSASMRVGEDVDLVWRLVEQGWRVRYEPGVVVRHDHRTRLLPWLSRRAFYGTGADELARRHGKAVAPAVLSPWTVTVVVALLAQRRWSLPLAGGMTALAARRLSARLSRSPDSVRLGAVLAAEGVVNASVQASALMLRHWWPATFVGCLFSRRLRRAVALAAVVDGIVEMRTRKPHLDPLRFLVARRLDDVAYGAGVWFGAARGRSFRSLLPDIRRQAR